MSAPLAGWDVRHLEEEDVSDCEALHERVHGFPRTRELRDTLATGSPVVALRDGAVRAYMAVPTFWIARLFRWCTAEGLRAIRPMTLVAKGVYHQPKGSYIPSVLY